MDHFAHGMSQAPASSVSFPYEFLRPGGRYRIWRQVKTGGKVETEVFG